MRVCLFLEEKCDCFRIGIEGGDNMKKFSTSLTSDEEQLAHLHEWKYKQKKDVTVDGKVITAVGSAYVEFAAEIMKQLNLFNEDEVNENLQYFKNVTEFCDETLV